MTITVRICGFGKIAIDRKYITCYNEHMDTKTLLFSQVRSRPSLDYPQGVFWGTVVRVAPKTIWIQDDHGTQAYRKKGQHQWLAMGQRFEKEFVFTKDPLITFLTQKAS